MGKYIKYRLKHMLIEKDRKINLLKTFVYRDKKRKTVITKYIY